MKKRKNNNGDDWVPSAKELAKFRPIKQVDPELLAAHEKGTLRRGRPRLEHKKQSVSLRLDPEILAAFKAKGKGWQSKINACLRAAVEGDRV